MVISDIWSILAGPNVDHISGTHCIWNLHVEGRWNWSRWDLDSAKMGGKRNKRRGKKTNLYMGISDIHFTDPTVIHFECDKSFTQM